MTDKITLATVSELQAFPSAAAAINSNSAILTAAMDNTLSRDGTAPNSMAANLDMNSNRIINLPTPVSNLEPARLVDLETLTGGGTIVINPVPTGGTTNQVLGKASNANFDTNWQTLNQLPSGGTTGQVLEKNTNTNFDAGWQNLPSIVNTIAGNSGAFTLGGGLTNNTNVLKLANNSAYLQASLSNPPNFGAGNQMVGLGSVATLTTVYSPRVMINFSGNISNNTANNSATLHVRFGTGTAPIAGASPVGSTVSNSVLMSLVNAGFQSFFSIPVIVAGLTPGTAYWFDLDVNGNANTTTFINLAFTGMEF